MGNIIVFIGWSWGNKTNVIIIHDRHGSSCTNQKYSCTVLCWDEYHILVFYHMLSPIYCIECRYYVTVGWVLNARFFNCTLQVFCQLTIY